MIFYEKVGTVLTLKIFSFETSPNIFYSLEMMMMLAWKMKTGDNAIHMYVRLVTLKNTTPKNASAST